MRCDYDNLMVAEIGTNPVTLGVTAVPFAFFQNGVIVQSRCRADAMRRLSSCWRESHLIRKTAPTIDFTRRPAQSRTGHFSAVALGENPQGHDESLPRKRVADFSALARSHKTA